MSIQWGRILLAAFLMELVLVVIAAPLALSGAAGALNYVIPPASFIVTFAVTVWLGRKFSSRPVLQGVLIGVAGTLMYVALTRAQPEPWPYLLANVLKMAGGAVGGMVLARPRVDTKAVLEGR